MIENLHIKNIAIIDEINIEFSDRLNVLTGETGAGKSIIIDSISAVLGGRVNREIIKVGAEKALVEAQFSMTDEVHRYLESIGIETEISDNVIISREIAVNGKNICRINGNLVNVAMLSEFGAMLIDIHGQHDNQSLFKVGNHIKMLDAFIGREHLGRVKEYEELYRTYLFNINELEQLRSSTIDIERKKDLLKYQINEIEAADVQDGELDELKEKRDFMLNAGAMVETLCLAVDALAGGENGVIDVLNLVTYKLDSIKKYSSDVEKVSQSLNSSKYDIEDMVEQLRTLLNRVDFSEQDLAQIEERYDTVKMLHKKYGVDYDALYTYLSDMKAELAQLENIEENSEELVKEIEKQKNELVKFAEEISRCRNTYAQKLETDICDELHDMEMMGAKFVVCNNKADEFSSNGFDRIEFMFSANVGHPPKPLSKIASGGEISRTMLAVKKILAGVDNIPTMIFDEIDIGLSGVAAKRVGEKMNLISNEHQVLAITHHAQIACFAKRHFVVNKSLIDSATVANVEVVENETRVEEIARLISGDSVSEISLNHAREMLKCE